jgi:hypothetical protein
MIVYVLCELAPILAMYAVSAFFGIAAGMWTLMAATLVSFIVVTLLALRRVPVIPIVFLAVKVGTSMAALLTGDPAWVQQPFLTDAVALALGCLLAFSGFRKLMRGEA